VVKKGGTIDFPKSAKKKGREDKLGGNDVKEGQSRGNSALPGDKMGPTSQSSKSKLRRKTRKMKKQASKDPPRRTRRPLNSRKKKGGGGRG